MASALSQRARRRPTDRQEEITRVGRAARAGGGQGKVNPQGVGMMNPPGRGNGQRFNPKTDIQQGLGRQLSRRVATGAITERQAQRTAKERQTLKAKFGADWRDKLPGGAGAFAKARQMLTANPNNPKLIALNKRLQGRRQQLLEAARGNGGAAGGNGGTTAPGASSAGQRQGRVNPRGRGMMNPPGEGPAPRRRRRPRQGGGY